MPQHSERRLEACADHQLHRLRTAVFVSGNAAYIKYSLSACYLHVYYHYLVLVNLLCQRKYTILS